MKKLILMTILFLTLQSSGYINFKGAHFRKLEEGEHYYYILRISPQNKNQRPYYMVNCTPKVRHKTFGVHYV